jgi:hypothetical protein
MLKRSLKIVGIVGDRPPTGSVVFAAFVTLKSPLSALPSYGGAGQPYIGVLARSLCDNFRKAK